MHNEDNTATLLGITRRQTKPFTFVYIQFPSARGNTIKGSDTINLIKQDLTYDFFRYTLVPEVQRNRKLNY